MHIVGHTSARMAGAGRAQRLAMRQLCGASRQCLAGGGFALLLAAAMPAAANDALAAKHGCLGCHAKTAKLVGPAYAEVAAKYAGQAGADKQVAARIRAGGSGRWGDMAMPPQTQLNEADALRLSKWILAAPK